MRLAALLLAPLFLASPVGPAEAALPELETITIDVAHTMIICVGFCPIYVVTARSDERIELAVRSLGWREGRPSRVRRWRGRQGDFQRMRSILAAIRPLGVHTRGEPCAGELCDEARRYRYILSWNGPDGAARLIANPMEDDQEVNCRVSRAVLDLGIAVGPDGMFRRDDLGRGWPLHNYCNQVLAPTRQPAAQRQSACR